MADPKQIDVECPCCKARLAVDVATRRVVRAAPPERLDASGKPIVGAADFDRALDRVQRRHEAGAGRFEDALERERRRSHDLDELFRRANEGKDRSREDDDPPSAGRPPTP